MDSILPALQLLSPGTVIPKSEAKGMFTIKGWGERQNGEAALIYSIPNRKGGKRYEKSITAAEWEQAYRQLLTAGELTREWLKAHMPRCSRQTCNFTTIGGIFSLLNIAVYESKGVYRKAE